MKWVQDRRLQPETISQARAAELVTHQTGASGITGSCLEAGDLVPGLETVTRAGLPLSSRP